MTHSIESPLGTLYLQATARGLRRVSFVELTAGEGEESAEAARHLHRAADELTEYFAGRRRSFSVALDPEGTDFQRAVWEELAALGFGQTISYGTIARHIGSPRGSQAVGLANGQNPLPIIVPCHRVVGRDGKLTGYAGGVERKQWLLRHESAALF